MWQGLQSIMDYKGKPRHDLPNDASLSDQLNTFYTRFDNNNIVPGMRAVTDTDDWVISPPEADVRKDFNQVNIHKAAEPTVFQGVFSHLKVPVCNPLMF
jgi:hypothetical protein